MIEKPIVILLFCLMLAGCALSQYPYYDGAYSYQQTTYTQTVAPRVQSDIYIGGPLDNSGGNYQVPTTTSSTTSRSEVGSAFSKKLATMRVKRAAAQQAAERRAQEQTLKDRERRINDYLWRNEIPGVSDTRMLLKNKITEEDEKLQSLGNDLRLAGRSPDSDAQYVEILNKRKRLAANLNAFDEKIMNVIVSRSTRNAAEAASFSSEEASGMSAAHANLQAAAAQYRSDTERIMKSANW